MPKSSVTPKSAQAAGFTMPMSSPDVVVLWTYMVRVVLGLQRTQDKAMRKVCKIPLSWGEVLVRLDAAPDKQLRMTELARVLILHKSRVTHLVTELEKRGLVERQRTDDDLRGYTIAMTEQGKVMRELGRQVTSQLLHEHLGKHLSDAEVKTWLAKLAEIPYAHLFTLGGAPAAPAAKPTGNAKRTPVKV